MLAALLRENNITDVFPHLSPTYDNGEIPIVEPDQIMVFLDKFTDSIRKLFSNYPDIAGIHINIEPCRLGNKEFLILVDEVRSVLPEGKILSVAAFPPPTIWHPFSSVHWDEEYYKQVSQRADQLVVMMYDTALHFEKMYLYVMARWTREVLEWSDGTDVLLGLPAYADEWAGYHDPEVENLENALTGIHTGLSKYDILPSNYQGVALYSEWEMDEGEWDQFKDYFMAVNPR